MYVLSVDKTFSPHYFTFIFNAFTELFPFKLFKVTSHFFWPRHTYFVSTKFPSPARLASVIRCWNPGILSLLSHPNRRSLYSNVLITSPHSSCSRRRHHAVRGSSRAQARGPAQRPQGRVPPAAPPSGRLQARGRARLRLGDTEVHLHEGHAGGVLLPDHQELPQVDPTRRKRISRQFSL